MRTFRGIDELAGSAGIELGTSAWLTIDQDRVDRFAEATDDHQWIHVDRERAAAGPYGGTIAHGFLTLSLVPALMRQLYAVSGVAMGINCGLGRVRFLTPVPVGGRIRAFARVASADRLEGAVQVVFDTTVELEGAARPAAVVESLVRFVG
ncbi:MaoC family dehydratase [Millisia brevis]|uniref:MaoC family dehydratase n=1 Tax=Millisia brevis TaxID=264148 RepID=UPI00082BB864|nr:MaoC family dehydratase [Millisia brevis]